MPYKGFIELKEQQSKSTKDLKNKKEGARPKEETKSKVSKNATDRGTMQSSHAR
jgi:hypothetical protein